MNAGAFRKEGSKWKPEQTTKRRKPKAGMEKKLERKEMDLKSEKGFTLLEVMSVLVILGVIFSVTIHRFTALSDTAYLKTLESGKRELNVQETLIWFDVKISTAGWQSDDDVFGQLDTQLGARYYWDPAVDEIGGTLHFGPCSIVLTRTPSTSKSAGSWK